MNLIALLRTRGQIVACLNNKDEYGKTGLEYLLEIKDQRSNLTERLKKALYQIKGIDILTLLTRE